MNFSHRYTCIPERKCHFSTSQGDIKMTILYFTLAAEKGNPGGAVYTRWGRSGCPKETELVYKGNKPKHCFIPDLNQT